jgi:hypothetical protein
LFWTVPLSPDAVDVQFGAGKARMSATNVNAPDFFNIPNALFRFLDPASLPAKCSFDIRWSGPVTGRDLVTGPPGSTGQVVMCQATMTWSARRADGFNFTSDPAGTTSAFAQLGHVQNGVFAH